MFENYSKNPVVLLQHNHEYGGIGYVNKLWLDKEGNLNILFFVDTNTLEGKTRYQVENGFITAVSTSHVTHEDMIEDNKTGERMTWEDAEGLLSRNELRRIMVGRSENYTLVVTKAEMIENSLVTIGSNEGAIVAHNSVDNYFSNKYSENLFTGILSNKLNDMSIEEIKALLNDAEISKDQKNKLIAKLNELEGKEKLTEEKKDDEEEKEDNKKEEDEEKEEEKKEDKKDDEATDEDEESTKSENDEDKSEESDIDGEKPVETEEKSTVSENVFDEYKNSTKEDFANLNKVIEAQDKLIKEQANTLELLKNGMAVVIGSVNTMQSHLKTIIVDGVSSFSDKKEEKKSPTQLTNLLQDLKK